jgi:chromosome partitioning protein
MILAVANQKGGVGKTTIAFSLAKMSAVERETLAIDLDPQGNLTSCFTESLPDSANVKLLWDKDKDGNPIDGQLTPVPLAKNFSLVGADISLSFWETGGGAAAYFKLSGWLKRRKEADSWTIIDCPPNLGIFSINAFIAADYVLIPVDASKFCIQGLDALFRSMKEVNRELRQDGGLKVAGILPRHQLVGKSFIQFLHLRGVLVTNLAPRQPLANGTACHAKQHGNVRLRHPALAEIDNQRMLLAPFCYFCQ